MNGELLRIVDTIHRDRGIEKDVVFAGIEQAFLSAVKKHFGIEEDVIVTIDRMSGAIRAHHGDREIEPGDLGRIAAQTAKQVMIQRIREAERDALYDEYKDRVGSIANGMVQRQESGCTIINLGKMEGILPRSEQIPGEDHSVGERIRCLVLEVRKVGQKVKVVLSRTHPDFIRRLFELEVPEVTERTIEIKALAREAGHRTKVAVTSHDSRVDAVGACVGVRGRRIKNIVEELSGEKIDIVRWNDSSQVLIMNALKPAEIEGVILSQETGRATVVVPEDQLSLAIGKKGQNVRLAARLGGWNIDIVTAAELEEQRGQAHGEFLRLSGVGPKMADRLVEAGFISVRDLLESGPDALLQLAGMGEKKVEEVLASASEMLPTLEVEAAERAVEMAARAQAEAERRAREQAERQAAIEAEEAEIAAARASLEAIGESPQDADAEGPDEAAAEADHVEEASEPEDEEAAEPGEEPTGEPPAEDEVDQPAAELAADTPDEDETETPESEVVEPLQPTEAEGEADEAIPDDEVDETVSARSEGAADQDDEETPSDAPRPAPDDETAEAESDDVAVP